MTNSGLNGAITAAIESFAGRARMTALALGATTIAVGLLMLVGVPGAPVREADASHVAYSTLSGKLIQQPQGYAVKAGAAYLYRWNGSAWGYTGRKATSNQYGYYSFSSVPSGYYYAVRGYKTYGMCTTGQAIYDGWSQTIDLRSPASSSRTGAHVSMSFQRYLYC